MGPLWDPLLWSDTVWLIHCRAVPHVPQQMDAGLKRLEIHWHSFPQHPGKEWWCQNPVVKLGHNPITKTSVIWHQLLDIAEGSRLILFVPNLMRHKSFNVLSEKSLDVQQQLTFNLDLLWLSFISPLPLSFLDYTYLQVLITHLYFMWQKCLQNREPFLTCGSAKCV